MRYTLTEITAFVTAVGAFLGALVLAYRGLSGDRFSRRVNESAALLTGYTEMVKNLRVEISDMRLDHDKDVLYTKKQYQNDLERLARLHKIELDSIIAIYTEERRQWEEERERLGSKINELDEKIVELQATVFTPRNPESKSRESDKGNRNG